MTTALRYRNARQIIPNSNLAFIRQYTEDKKEKTKDAKTVAAQILQSEQSQSSNSKVEQAPVNARAAAEQIITDFPEEPTTCCMSGCANCVWLEYAEKISAYYRDGGDKALREIDEKVSDPNVKAFLLHELRMRQKAS